MIHTKDENTFKGALVDQRRDGFVLRAAAYVQLDQNKAVRWVSLDGDVVIPTENVSFWQDALDASLLDVVGRLPKEETG